MPDEPACWCGEDHAIAHGTPGGYQRHGRLSRAGHTGVEPCQPCKDSVAEYARGYRAGLGRSVRKRTQAKQSCRNRALRELADMYPDKMRALYKRELRRQGLA